MSFGYGVGDCIVVGKLAWKVYEDFRQAPEIFHNLHLEVLALHTVLEKVKQTLNNAILPPEFQSDLKIIINCCDSVLQSLNELAVKYKKVGEKTRSPFDRIRLSNEDIAGSRQRLIASITMLTMFIMTSPTPFQQEQIRLIEENQRGRRGSIASIQTVDSLSREERIAWRGLRKELEGLGITAQILESNHNFIMDLFVRTKERGTFEENPPANAANQAMLAIGPPKVSRTPSPTLEGIESHSSENAILTPPTAVPVKERCKNTNPIRDGSWTGIIAHCGDESCDAHVPMELQHTLRPPAEITAGPLPNARYHRSSRSRYQHQHIYQLLKQKPRPEIPLAVMDRALLDACMYPSTVDMVETFLKHGASPDAHDWRGEAGFMFSKVDETLLSCSALMLAASQGRNDIVRILINWGANIDYHLNDSLANTKDRMGWMSTPLGCAVTGGDLATVRTILSAGASVNMVEKLQGTWWTALHEACRVSTEEICEELLNWGAEIDLLSKQGTPLMVALYVRKYEMVRLLLKRGANANITMQKANIHGHKRPMDVALWVANDSEVWFLDDDIPVIHLLEGHGAKTTDDEKKNIRNLHERREGWKLDSFDNVCTFAHNDLIGGIYTSEGISLRNSKAQRHAGSSVGS